MRSAKVAEILHRMQMGDSCQMAVRLGPAPFGGIASHADCAPYENFAHANLRAPAIKGYRVGGDGDINTVDIQNRGRDAGFDVLRVPQIQFVRSTLKRFDHVDAALCIVPHQGPISGVVSTILEVQHGPRYDAIYVAPIS